MDIKKQNHKRTHVVIVTSDDADAGVKQFKIQAWVATLVIVIVCVLIGVILGYLVYEEQIWARANSTIDGYKDKITVLEQDLKDLEAQKDETTKKYEKEIEELNDKLTLMSDTVNQKVAEVDELSAQVEAMYLPTRLPITGSVTIEESEGEEPVCIFYTSDGAMVLATASGTVTEMVEETSGEYRVVIDHGNGYSTVYRNHTTPKVKFGDAITQGDTIFVIDAVNTKFHYQILQEGTYIDPMSMMQISG